MTDTSSDLSSWDREHLIHPATNLRKHVDGQSATRVMETGSGVFVVDSLGQKSLDAFSGLWCVNAGYGREEIVTAITNQARQLAYYPAYAGHGTDPSIRLAKMIIERMPQHMSKVFFGLTGSDANETNIKLIWYYHNVIGKNDKKKIISRRNGYHGSSIMAGSLTGINYYHEAFDLPRNPIMHTIAPFYYHRENIDQTEEQFSSYCADELEQLIISEGPDTVAAFFAEPVLGTGGVVPPPKTYWEKIQAVLKKYDVLLVADEVVTGFGRLGSMSGSEHYGLRPDLITIAKGLTSAYAPLSGVVVSDKISEAILSASDLLDTFAHGWTYSAHPICAAAGVANLELIDKLGLVNNAREVGAYLLSQLKSVFHDHKHVGDVRGVGLMVGLEFVADRDDRVFFEPSEKVAHRINSALLAQGVIGRAMPQDDILGFAPPLCLTREEADMIVSATKKSVDAVLPGKIL